MFVPTKSAAENALQGFLPHAGRDYGAGRNYDNGPEGKSTVSQLSPWIRIRLLPEWEVLSAVLQTYSPEHASKFIDEVCWRTYWKGWLQRRPGVWQNYLKDLADLLETYRHAPEYLNATQGRTGIKCFDSWNQELLENNYLHNHARMWYASIWIHTLKLPWQLGADWFLRHLLDGDPASNTLSWRWVGGLHTRGKTYLARQDNIRKYTNQRFQVRESLAEVPFVKDEPRPPEAMELPDIEPVPKGLRLGLLLTEEDLSADDWIPARYPVAGTARYFPINVYQKRNIRPRVVDFRYEALSHCAGAGIFEDSNRLLEWVRNEGLDGLITAEPSVGHWPELLNDLNEELTREGKKLFTLRHWWDETLFPHAAKGFFRFKKAIPKALDLLSEDSLNQRKA